MYWISKGLHQAIRTRRRILVLLAVLGPGLITMVADNDAGGISTYAVSGSLYGFNLLWMLFLLVPMAYYVQEMTVRLGAVTKRGHAESVFNAFGPLWGWFSILDLALINWLTLITEYIGMTVAMAIFGIPPWITFIGVTFLLTAVVVTGKYWTFEKITLLFCAFNLIYIPAAIWAMKTQTAPPWSAVMEGFTRVSVPGGLTPGLLFIVMAIIGTTITPWQIFFQQSMVVDKSLDVHDLSFGRMDTLVGSIITCLVAAFIIITTGAAFYYHHPPIVIQDAGQTAEALAPLLPKSEGEWARILFAVGLFDAGFLGALCISLSSSWAVGEIKGWAHSLNKSVKDAPWFYAIYILFLLSAGAVVLIPNAPLISITMFVQVVAVTLLPADMIFLILMLNDRDLMGEYVNTRRNNVIVWTIAVVVIVMSTIFALSGLFPHLFGGAS